MFTYHRTLILSILLTIAIWSSSCDYGRTPSKERFQKNCDVTIPVDIQTTKDEYQDMTNDYGIDYRFKLTSPAMRTFLGSIRHSDYYNDTIGIHKSLNQIILNGIPADRGIWRRTAKGYRFYKHEHLTEITMEVDTTTNAVIAYEGYGA